MMRRILGFAVAVGIVLGACSLVFAGKVPERRPNYEPGVLIVKLRPGATLADVFAELSLRKSSAQSAIIPGSAQPLFHSLRPEASAYGLDRVYKLQVQGPYSEPHLAKLLSGLRSVEYAEPNYIYEAHYVPNDSLFSQQWYLNEIHAPEAWDVERGDPAVIIGIVDTGVDIDHPDLADKIWTNPGEIPGNGRDDDGNGFVDDVHGWDFVNNVADPNPKPNGQDEDGDGMADDGTDHGTEMAGLAAATTDNGKGVAGVAFRCSIMPVKALSDEGSGTTADLTEGIRYAIENGAHVVNMSFGGGGFSQLQKDVIDYGLSRNVIFVAAAGNNGTIEEHFPSGYHGVLSVAATGFNGKVSSISNYGPGIDVAAPGGDFNSSPPAEMISTVPYFPEYGFDEYYRARTKEGYLTAGTSSACALVSGVAALVRSHFPSDSWLDIQKRIAGTCTNIDDVNPGYEGLLGDGLVNAYLAVATEQVPEVRPRIVLLHASVTDSTLGDGDGLYEHGEIVTVVATYRNYSVGEGKNVRITLSSPDPAVEIVEGEYVIPSLPSDSTVTMSTPLSFLIRPDAPGHVGKIVLTHEAAGAVGSDTVLVTIGKTPVLVVDDDHDEVGGNTGDYDIEGYTITSLERLGINYAVWDIETNGHPSGDFLRHFPIVIWLCEWAFPSLDANDRAALRQFLDGGGSLFLSGQDIGWDLNDPTSDNATEDAKQFFENYLHARYLSDDAGSNKVFGVPGDPIGNSFVFNIYQPGREEDYQYPDVIEPLPGAWPILRYDNGGVGGVRWAGSYRVVYMGFGFEAVDSRYSTPPSAVSEIRDLLMARVLEYLSTIEHEPLSDTEDITAERVVVARLHGDISDLQSVRLYWRKQGEVEFHSVEMVLGGERTYVATIPAPNEAAVVEYYIETKNPYFAWRKPAGAPAQLFRFYAGPDTVAPVIEHAGLPNTINGEDPFEVIATVSDNTAVDGSNVWIHFYSAAKRDSARLHRTALRAQFRGEIPPIFAYGDTVRYFITALDSSSQRNFSQTDTFQFVVGLEDFESGLRNWRTPSGGWGLETLYAHSGEFSVNDSPGGQYPNNANVSLETNFGFDLSGTTAAVLRYWTRYFLELGHDYGYVEVSTDGGNTWQQVGEPVNGVATSWTLKEVSLTPFTGPGMTDVRVRFRMQSDATQVPPFFGWFIDDVQILEGVETSVSEKPAALPVETALHPNYPNPFNPSTTFEYELAAPARVSLRIYNLLGQEVRALVDRHQPAGRYRVQWDGKDERGALVPGGVYLVRFEAGDVRQVRKLLLLK